MLHLWYQQWMTWGLWVCHVLFVLEFEFSRVCLWNRKY